MKDLNSRKTANIAEVVGAERAKDPSMMGAWAMLGGLASHDLSAMRELIGMPEKCLVATKGDGRWWSALFGYKGFKAYFEVSSGSRSSS